MQVVTIDMFKLNLICNTGHHIHDTCTYDLTTRIYTVEQDFDILKSAVVNTHTYMYIQ